MQSLKHSRQREAIKELLMSRKDHPTADMVYTDIRKDYPNISLATVYRNLSLLAELGEIQKLSTGDGVDHYDADISPHAHFTCTNCGRVLDIELDADSLTGLIQAAKPRFKGTVESASVNFYGLCPECGKETHKDKA